MAFVKLDTGILDSTLWIERECREVFITALLLAEPFELEQPMEQFEIRSLEKTGFVVPPGWYGLVRAAGVGILRRAMVEQEPGLIALERLGSADLESRSSDFEGRRLVRVDGGFIVLNFMKYRDRDHTAATRSKRYRERQKTDASRRSVTVIHRNVTQADADADAEKSRTLFDRFWLAYPRKEAKKSALKAFLKLKFANGDFEKVLAALEVAKKSQQWVRDGGKFIPHPASWLNGRRFEDEQSKPAKPEFHL